jgi:hypothetical protein
MSSRLKGYLLQLLRFDSYAVEVHELRLLTHALEPLQVTDDLTNYFELSELQHLVSDQVRYFGGRPACISVSSGQLIYKKIPHSNQWFWDIHADRACVRVEPIPSGIVPPNLRSVSYDPEVQIAQSERNNRESFRPQYSSSRGAYNPYTPEKPFQAHQTMGTGGLDRLLSPFEMSPNPRGGVGSSLRSSLPLPANRTRGYEQTPHRPITTAPLGSSSWSGGWPRQQPPEVIDVLGTMSSQKGPRAPIQPPPADLIPETSMFGTATKVVGRAPFPGSNFGSPSPYGAPAPSSAFGAMSEPLIGPGLGGTATAPFPGPQPARGRVPGFPLAAKTGDEAHEAGSRSGSRDKGIVEDLSAAVKAGLLKWEDVVFNEETIRYAKENYATLKANKRGNAVF